MKTYQAIDVLLLSIDSLGRYHSAPVLNIVGCFNRNISELLWGVTPVFAHFFPQHLIHRRHTTFILSSFGKVRLYINYISLFF